jgi:hypothetical protein
VGEDVVVSGSYGISAVELRLFEITVEREALLHLLACIHLGMLHFGAHCEDGGAVVGGVVNYEGG